VTRPHGPEEMLNFSAHINSPKPSNQFTKGIKEDLSFHFMGILGF
jgi:hypothetical protein